MWSTLSLYRSRQLYDTRIRNRERLSQSHMTACDQLLACVELVNFLIHCWLAETFFRSALSGEASSPGARTTMRNSFPSHVGWFRQRHTHPIPLDRMLRSTVVCRRGDTHGQTLTFLGSINAGCWRSPRVATWKLEVEKCFIIYKIDLRHRVSIILLTSL